MPFIRAQSPAQSFGGSASAASPAQNSTMSSADGETTERQTRQDFQPRGVARGQIIAASFSRSWLSLHAFMDKAPARACGRNDERPSGDSQDATHRRRER